MCIRLRLPGCGNRTGVPEWEHRFVGYGYLDKRLHVLCFKRDIKGLRIISFRKANQREAKRIGKPTTDDDGEVRELQHYDVPFFRPFPELSVELKAELLSLKRPERKPSLRVKLAPEVVERFQATGEGWEGRIETVLREWLRDHGA